MKDKKQEEKVVTETMKILESLSEKNSTFAPPILALLKSMNPEMRAYCAQMTADALNAAKEIRGASLDPDFAKYATNKKKNG